MAPGPSKSFDPDQALLAARDTFWRLGFDGTGIADLEAELGIGRKSLYDTFGNKRELYLKALQRYADTVIQRICERLENPQASAISNLERTLERLAQHHGSGESQGCLLGVAMAQAQHEDEELAQLIRSYLKRLERALERALRQAQQDGDVRSDLSPRDSARNLVALTQGLALMGRVSEKPAMPRSVVRASLAALRA
jgi:TetR/AcrR family transcriptional repressor of nem operon